MDRTDQTAIMESDAVDLNQLKHKIYQEAIRDIGQSGYEAHMRDLFGRPVLDFCKNTCYKSSGFLLCKLSLLY